MFKKNQILLLASLYAISSSSLFGMDANTLNLRQEVLTHNNPNASPETHPTLWALVGKISKAANVSKPRYITLHEAQTLIVDDNHHLHQVAQNIQAWVDILGDLYICKEILKDLSYAEIEGILAVAISERAINKPAKVLAIGAGTWVATAATVTALGGWKTILRMFMGDHNNGMKAHQDNFGLLLYTSAIPAILAAAVASNNLQKQADMNAVHVVDANNVINGITGLERLKDTYIKENFFSRLTTMLKLRDIYNFVFYPVRSYTPEERVAYLAQI